MVDNQGMIEPPSSNAMPAPATHSIRRRLAFAAIAVAVGLLLIEMASRLFLQWTPNPRWEYESRHIQTIGFPALNDILMPDVARFWRLKPNVDRANIRGSVAGTSLAFTLSTDEYGCRRMPVVPGADRAILFLGDSCTLGIGVSDDETIPSRVQQRLPGVRCVNAGVPGYTAYQGRETLLELGPTLRPAVVLICFGFNDGQPWDDTSDIEHGRRISAWSSGWTADIGIARLIARTMHRTPVAVPGGGRPRLTDAEYLEQIAAMVDWCRDHEATPVVVVWPLREQLTRPVTTSKQAALRRFAADRGLACVDLIELFTRLGDPALFVDVIHASPAGCDRAANAIVEMLSSDRR